MQQRVVQIEQRLARLVPLARPGSGPAQKTSAKMNSEVFPALDAKFVRFTIYDANLHPSLGLIEPCVDEFEIFTDEPQPRNVALASHGTKVTSSGSRISELHRLEHINDGRYGNSRSWMSDTAGRGSVLFALPESARIARIVWSRDREGKYEDRLATAYTLEAGRTLDAMKTLVDVPPPRPSVNARLNTDRFAPVQAKRVRFTIRGTNSLEPCVDELEIFDASGANVALASAGTVVTSSGDTVVADHHELRFINDGRSGNARSWMSNERGQGWVVLEFSQARTIERVVWSRDREGKFTDRLATNYVIEVAAASGEWRLVADSSDRATNPKGDKAATVFLAGLSTAEAQEATSWLDEKKTLEQKIRASAEGRMVFAGKFRAPDKIHLLSRGDPEQPKEEVLPAMLGALDNRSLAKDTAEQPRRAALAAWIASAQNPLTARVMVNRIWQGHFGTGLVGTPSDFGRNGLKPSHPELLDWLAGEFVRTGWSAKQLHRLIVLSASYRQSSSTATNKGYGGGRPATSLSSVQIDSEVRLLWRYPSRRLEAETIRDSMLAVSGRLNLKMFGRGFNLFEQRGGLSGFKPVDSFSGDGLRRMIYAHKVRREREAVFGAFDCPDAGQSTARRRESITPLQALNLFNSRFTLDESAAFAARVKSESGDDVPGQIRRAYELALSRPPSVAEMRDAEPIVQAHGLVTLCRALFNSNEFLFVP